MLGLILGNWQRFLVYGVVALLIAGMLELDGYRRGERKLWEYQAKEAAARVVIVTKQGTVTEKVVTKYIKVREATQTIANGIKNEVIKYVETNPGYCLDARWGVLHDAAAANTVPESVRSADEPLRAPTAAGALETVTANYGACNRTADKLDALQDWVKAQQKVK